jgi:hypothetical protein
MAGAVLFAEIAAPPMNLLGPELVRDRISSHSLSVPRATTPVACWFSRNADRCSFISHVDVTRITTTMQN